MTSMGDERQITVRGQQMLEKVASKHGNGAIVCVPKDWIGRRVLIVLLSEGS